MSPAAMHERWATVPTDFDEARRFATEYEIEAEHAIKAQPLAAQPSVPELGGEGVAATLEKLRRAQQRLDGPRAGVRAHMKPSGTAVMVSLKTDRLEWTLELRGGEPYELPSSLVERFAADHRRLCGRGD